MNEYSGFAQKIAQSIISDAQTGDLNAMETIYRTYGEACNKLAFRITGSQQACEDIVHEVFIKIMNRINKYSNSGTFSGWIRTIAVNESINYIKKNSKHLDLLELEDNLRSNDLFENKWWDACSDLSKLTKRLSDDARAVLYLHEIEGYSHKEIGKLFNKTESFSKQSLSRALTQLKNMNAIKEVKNASN